MVLSMSVESRVLEMSAWRKLRKEEMDLITAMTRYSPKSSEVLRSLPERLVKDMKDGGMGSLRFKAGDNRERRLGKKIAEAEFTDDDGVPVSAVLNLDDHGDLFELDMWKVDFSALKRHPRPEELRVSRPGETPTAISLRS
jgi:hypothetical protein